MPTPDIQEDVARLRARLEGRENGDTPIDTTAFDALTLGDLYAAASAVERWGTFGNSSHRIDAPITDAAEAVIFHREKPIFTGPACRDYLDVLARKVEADVRAGKRILPEYEWRDAAFALRRCIARDFDGVAAAAKNFLAVADWEVRPHIALVLARVVDADFLAQAFERFAALLADSPLLLGELRTAAAMSLVDHLFLIEVVDPHDRADDAPEHHPLSAFPLYVGFVEQGLRAAAARLDALHAGKIPYASDKTFTLRESPVLARLARVALDRDEAWLPPVLDDLFRKVSRAPIAAKSVPSQSVSIALGHAIEAFPTPEAVETLRGVLRDCRHAGVKGKLQRNVRGSARALAGRPEVALRLPLDAAPSTQQLTTLVRCLEASLAIPIVLDVADWRARLAGHANVRRMTAGLVWRLGSVAVLPVPSRDGVAFADSAGAIVETVATTPMTLWHPAEASVTEREVWRDRLTELRIKQPFKQIFREHYVVAPDENDGTTTAAFAGHVVSVVPLLGVARRERWHLDYDVLVRAFGRWTARFDLADHIYPGFVGATKTGPLTIRTAEGDARLDDVPAATLSEIMRAADLLVSTSGFALDTPNLSFPYDERLQTLAERPLTSMAAMRKVALARALHGLAGMETLSFDARHLRLDGYAIHLATGRVTRDGSPVVIDLPQKSGRGAVPWLPHDEKLLEAIAATALAIAGVG